MEPSSCAVVEGMEWGCPLVPHLTASSWWILSPLRVGTNLSFSCVFRAPAHKKCSINICFWKEKKAGHLYVEPWIAPGLFYIYCVSRREVLAFGVGIGKRSEKKRQKYSFVWAAAFLKRGQDQSLVALELFLPRLKACSWLVPVTTTECCHKQNNSIPRREACDTSRLQQWGLWVRSIGPSVPSPFLAGSCKPSCPEVWP